VCYDVALKEPCFLYVNDVRSGVAPFFVPPYVSHTTCLRSFHNILLKPFCATLYISHILYAAQIYTQEGLNLTVLLTTLVPADMTKEDDTLWTFESLLRVSIVLSMCHFNIFCCCLGEMSLYGD